MKRSSNPTRCEWCLGHELFLPYHDEEWGVPEHDDRKLFEMLLLEGAQAGVTWLIVLKKRENYRRAFDHFNPHKIARYGEKKIAALLQDAGIIRNRLKVNAAVTNARAFLQVQEEFGSFDRYIWQFVGGQPRVNRWKTLKEVPPHTVESDTMSKDLKKRGFKFVGSTICYAFMQACGLVNDHATECFRWSAVKKMK